MFKAGRGIGTTGPWLEHYTGGGALPEIFSPSFRECVGKKCVEIIKLGEGGVPAAKVILILPVTRRVRDRGVVPGAGRRDVTTDGVTGGGAA